MYGKLATAFWIKNLGSDTWTEKETKAIQDTAAKSSLHVLVCTVCLPTQFFQLTRGEKMTLEFLLVLVTGLLLTSMMVSAGELNFRFFCIFDLIKVFTLLVLLKLWSLVS